MKFEIEIDENYITELVSQKIAERILTEHSYENIEAQIGVRFGVDEAVKQYIYAEKDSIIERVVEKATVEITKKGLPKLLDRLEEMTAAEIVKKGLPKLMDRLEEVQNGK